MKKHQLMALLLAASTVASSLSFGEMETIASSQDLEIDKKTDLLATPSNAEIVSTSTPSSAINNNNEQEDEQEEKINVETNNKNTPTKKATPSEILKDFFYEKVVSGYKITLRADAGVFPDETKVEIKKVDEVDDVNIDNIIEDELAQDEEAKKIVSFDISFWVNGEEIQPEDGLVEVCINLKRDLAKDAGESAKIFHIIQDNMIEEINCTIDSNKNVIYNATTFSVYSVVLLDQGDYTPIYTADDLQNINLDLDGSYKLMNDISLYNVVWTPIGDSPDNSFNGDFDGQGYTISDLSLKMLEIQPYAGLFGYVNNGTIKNVNLDAFDLDIQSNTASASGGVWAGSLIGWANDRTVVENCHVTGTNIFADCPVDIGVGGIIGHLSSLAAIQDSSFEGTVGFESSAFSTMSPYGGGIVGRSNGAIEKCINYGDVDGKSTNVNIQAYAGGIAGVSGGGGIDQCANYGNISVTASSDSSYFSSSARAGGIAGYGLYDITNCYNTGEITAITYSGSSEATTTVRSYAGGIVGESNTSLDLSACYNIGSVKAESILTAETTQSKIIIYQGEIAASLGGNAEKPKIANCYYLSRDIEAFGDDGGAIDNVIGYTSTGLQNVDVYKGFDFETTWTMGTKDYLYPVFQWQSDEVEAPDIPEENEPLALISVTPANGTKNVKTTDEIIIEFNKEILYSGLNDQCIYIKDYDSDEVIYKYDASAYVSKIILKGALLECKSSHCYIYIPANAISAKILNTETGQEELEYFEGITDKNQYSFWMEGVGKTYVAIFNSMGGSNVGNRAFEEGTPVRRPSDPTKEGYSFSGWFLDMACTKIFDFETILDHDVTLYAGWKPVENSSEGSSNSGGGSSSSSNGTSNSFESSNAANNYSDNWLNVDGSWKCLGDDGNPLTGYQQGLYWNGIKGNWYFDENGNMVTGWHDGRYFNESANGYRGMEITDTTILGYIQGGDAKSTIAGYTYAVTFVDDIDEWTKMGSSLKNWANEFKATAVGLWTTFFGDGGNLTQNIADAYMKDPESSKAFLADMVNEMFSTETWRQSYVIDIALLTGGKIAEGDENQYVTIINNYWDSILNNVQQADLSMWDELVKINSSIDKAEATKNLFGTIKDVLNVNQEYQKMMMDYTQNIAYLEDLKKSVSSNSILGQAIDTLISDYQNQTINSVSNIFLQLYETMNTLDDFKDFDNFQFYIPSSDDSSMDILKSTVDKLAGTNFGKVDMVIQLAFSQADNVSAVDKVVYSTYLRNDAIAALNNVIRRIEDENATTESLVKEYGSAFECARIMTVAQYKNMLKYYESGAYTKEDRQNKIIYLNEEISKLEHMTFIDYNNKSAFPYYAYVPIQ